jgi:RimJ/RimL family protein N-acetyltransferase
MLAFLGSDRAGFCGGPMSAGEAWKAYAIHVGQWALRGYGLFSVALKATDAVVGMVGPHHPHDAPEPEMRWLLTDAAHEGHGFAYEAARAALDHLFDTLRWDSVVSYIDPADAASRALASRLGAHADPATPSPIPGRTAYRHTPAGGTA